MHANELCLCVATPGICWDRDGGVNVVSPPQLVWPTYSHSSDYVYEYLYLSTGTPCNSKKMFVVQLERTLSQKDRERSHELSQSLPPKCTCTKSRPTRGTRTWSNDCELSAIGPWAGAWRPLAPRAAPPPRGRHTHTRKREIGTSTTNAISQCNKQKRGASLYRFFPPAWAR